MGVAAAWCASAQAIVVENQAGTTAAPIGAGNDPGWNNVTIGVPNSRNFVYLGDGWAISARHVGPEPSHPNQSLYFSSGTIDIIPGQNYVVPNPGGVENPGSNQLSLTSDLRLVRLKAEPPGLSSIFDASPQFTIASQGLTAGSPEAAQPVTFIGHGRTRFDDPNPLIDDHTYWNSSWQEVPPNPGPVAYTGYKANSPNDDTKRWGTNLIADENPLFGHTDSDLRITFRQNPDTANVRDTVTMVTQFDAPGVGVPLTEAQAVDGDSGSAVFQKRNGQWQLVGLINFVYTRFPDTDTAAPNQPGFPNPTAVYENLTAFADLSFYHGEIFNIINSNSNYSILGDIDLDGKFLDDLTDDMAAFASGWGFNNGQGQGNLASWSRGDLSGPLGLRDGKTDVFDFMAFRDAMNNPLASAALANMIGLGVSVVPEPTSAVLALFAVASFAAFGRRRRRPGS